MALLDDVRDDLLALRSALIARQVIFANNHGGRCFQGLSTHSTIPQDGNLELPDRLLNHPHYQPETWLTFIPTLPALLRFACEINQYETPTGEFGFFVVIRVREGALAWERYFGFGPQADMFTTEWRRFIP